eukprot:612622-Hanusia_phi.AAC.2
MDKVISKMIEGPIVRLPTDQFNAQKRRESAKICSYCKEKKPEVKWHAYNTVVCWDCSHIVEPCCLCKEDGVLIQGLGKALCPQCTANYVCEEQDLHEEWDIDADDYVIDDSISIWKHDETRIFWLVSTIDDQYNDMILEGIRNDRLRRANTRDTEEDTDGSTADDDDGGDDDEMDADAN